MAAEKARVVGLAFTVVKGLALRGADELTVERSGVPDNRRFYLIDERSRMVNGKHMGKLCTIVADYQDATRALTLRFPDGTAVAGTIVHDGRVDTRFYSRPARAELVAGPWSKAISTHVGQPLRLVETDASRVGVDRGAEGAVSVISRASVGRLGAEAGGVEVDVRRFRMLIEIDGVAAHEEDGWVGRRARLGEVLVAVRGHVGRCNVTTRHPETGEVDLPVLDVLGDYRSGHKTTAPLAFGIYGEVLEPGTVRVGDAVQVG